MSSRGERESETQVRSRDDNESLAQASVGDAHMTSFRCECGDEACTCAISLTLEEYEHVRGYATHFAIAQNHENPESEQLIEEHGRFDVMEPVTHDAVKLARERNPRRGRGSALDRARAERTALIEQALSIPIRGAGRRRSVPVDDGQERA